MSRDLSPAPTELTSPAGDGAGLGSAEAARLLEEFGPNEIVERRRSLLLEIGSHFWGPIRG